MDKEAGDNKRKAQYGLRELAALAVASAVWVWIFREISPSEIAILAGIVLTAGLLGHVVYKYLLPWRVTGIASVWLFYNLMLLLSTAPSMDGALELPVEMLVQPMDLIWRERTIQGMLFSAAIVLGTIIFTPAHAFRPSLPTAIMTAIGIGIWYCASFLMMAYGG